MTKSEFTKTMPWQPAEYLYLDDRPYAYHWSEGLLIVELYGRSDAPLPQIATLPIRVRMPIEPRRRVNRHGGEDR